MEKYPHFCKDWDMMLVYPGCPEIEVCQCNEPILKKGDKVKTSFDPRKSEIVRTVELCYQAKKNCQTGYMIRTSDGLDCDAAWFSEI